ncbi:MAG TPA: DinB family protein [Pyrinomonadaceae bacterium]|nr:DinB family protein [Pyrinomonadaceae bacterium]
MLRDTLIKLYERDLAKLRQEVESYPNEADLWKKSGDIPNSAGNLALHLTGNLKHFIGAVLGESGYVRDRPAEFASMGVSREQILADIDETLSILKTAINKLTDDDFAKTYPIEVFGEPMSTGYFLVHLTTHFNYHLGQIDYHRRLLAAK